MLAGIFVFSETQAFILIFSHLFNIPLLCQNAPPPPPPAFPPPPPPSPSPPPHPLHPHLLKVIRIQHTNFALNRVLRKNRAREKIIQHGCQVPTNSSRGITLKIYPTWPLHVGKIIQYTVAVTKKSSHGKNHPTWLSPNSSRGKHNPTWLSPNSSRGKHHPTWLSLRHVLWYLLKNQTCSVVSY